MLTQQHRGLRNFRASPFRGMSASQPSRQHVLRRPSTNLGQYSFTKAGEGSFPAPLAQCPKHWAWYVLVNSVTMIRLGRTESLTSLPLPDQACLHSRLARCLCNSSPCHALHTARRHPSHPRPPRVTHRRAPDGQTQAHLRPVDRLR